MSVFVQQQHSINDFSSSDSWVILSEIELSIKRKIEAAGTPLKDWDIQIYRGVLTGYNEAFIISTEKRDEILANCHSEEERAKTAELIRPILRGRDIKRYGYEWANLWLIATFPARQYDINNYPAVTNYLLSFAKQQLIDAGYSWVANDHLADYCKQKLSQTGKFIEIDGKRITLRNSQEKARKKTSNKWFETQDSISYWDDFSKPKIVWGNLNLRASFAMVLDDSFVNAPSPMIVPASKYLLGMLNSKIADYYIRNLGVTRNGGYFEYKPMFVEQLPVPFTSKYLFLIEELVELKNEKRIDEVAYEIYGLTQEEIGYVESILNQ